MDVCGAGRGSDAPEFPVFLSIVYVLRNRAGDLEDLIAGVTACVSGLVSDYELIIVDNASEDDSVLRLKRLTRETGVPNVQVFALTKQVDIDTASWVGIENALGDFVVMIDPLVDDVGFLPKMLDEAVKGADVVFARNLLAPAEGWAYRMARAAFNKAYKAFSGVNLGKEAPLYRVLSKRVVNYILQHPQPAIAYRYLPAAGGFARANLTYSAMPRAVPEKSLGDGIDRGVRLLVSTTHVPMRLITLLSLFGALANVVYSIYVFIVAMTNPGVARGWASLSLQLSGMFFLISLVLLVLGEYVLNSVSLSNEGPKYYIGQEFTSVRMTRHEKLNIEEAGAPVQDGPVADA